MRDKPGAGVEGAGAGVGGWGGVHSDKGKIDVGDEKQGDKGARQTERQSDRQADRLTNN